MAFRLKVEFENLQSVLTLIKLRAVAQFQNLSLANILLDPNRQDIVITDVLLDSDSKNLYFFQGDTNAVIVNISEALALQSQKIITDAMAVAELADLETGLAKGDIATITESITTLLIFERQFSDSLSVNENLTRAFEAEKSDIANVAENYSSLFTTSRADTSSIAESSDVVPNKRLGTPPSSGTTITYTVTVAAATSGGGNRFYINGAENPTIDIEGETAFSGATYRFDQSHSSNTNHPFKFSETSNGTHGGGSEHLADPDVTVVGTAGQSGAYVEIEASPIYVGLALYYYCGNHSGMGNKINLIPAQRVSMSESFSQSSNFSRIFSDAYSLDDTASASDDLATQSGINKNNIVSVAESLNVSAFGKPLTDTATINETININGANQFIDTANVADSPSLSFSPANIANSVSVSESIDVQLIAGGTSGALLNKSALNTFSINS